MGAKYIQFTMGTTNKTRIDEEFDKRQERDHAKGLRRDPEYHREFPLDWASMRGPVHDLTYEGAYDSWDSAYRAVSYYSRRNDPVAVQYRTNSGQKRVLVAGWVSV